MNARLLCLAPAAAALTIALAGCSDPPVRGVVVSTEFNAAHYDEYMYCGVYTTTYVGNVPITNCTLWLTGQSWVRDAWSLKLKDGKHTGWRDVPKSTYDRCPMDATYPDCEAPHGA